MESNGYWWMTAVMLTPLVLWASWIDYRERRVPNRLNLVIALLGLAVQAAWHGPGGLEQGLLGGLTGLGLLIVPWLAYMMGAGDVKLLAAAGVWLGPWYVLWAFVIGAMLGGLASVVMIIQARRWAAAGENFQVAAIKLTHPQLLFSELGSVKSLGVKAQLIPYGVPLTAGTLIVLVLRLAQVM